MNRLQAILKPFMPILATGYGVALISLTSLPIGSMESTVISELLTVLLSLAAIALTLFLVKRYYPVVFPSSAQFSFKSPSLAIIAGILLIAPLWFVTKEYIIYGLTSLTGSPQLEPMTCSMQDLKEDLIAGGNLTAIFLEIYCWSGLGRLQISGTPVILLPDLPVIIVSILLAVAGLFLIKKGIPTHQSKSSRKPQ